MQVQLPKLVDELHSLMQSARDWFAAKGFKSSGFQLRISPEDFSGMVTACRRDDTRRKTGIVIAALAKQIAEKPGWREELAGRLMEGFESESMAEYLEASAVDADSFTRGQKVALAHELRSVLRELTDLQLRFVGVLGRFFDEGADGPVAGKWAIGMVGLALASSPAAYEQFLAATME